MATTLHVALGCKCVPGFWVVGWHDPHAKAIVGAKGHRVAGRPRRLDGEGQEVRVLRWRLHLPTECFDARSAELLNDQHALLSSVGPTLRFDAASFCSHGRLD